MAAIPTYSSLVVHAGFPSPAADWIEQPLDLNLHLIYNPESTFILRVIGHSMKGCGIYDGDEIIVDRSLPPMDGNVVVAVVNNGLSIKRLRKKGDRMALMSHPEQEDEQLLLEAEKIQIWGVVTRCLHRV